MFVNNEKEERVYKKVRFYVSAMESIPQEYSSLSRYTLQSFYSKLGYRNYEGFMVDSGGFSFFKKRPVSLEVYTKRYIEFLQRWKTQLFFNVDLFGDDYSYLFVRDHTLALEEELKKKSIWVWHWQYGHNYFEDFLKNSGNLVALSCANVFNRREATRVLPKLVNKKDVHLLGCAMKSLLAHPVVVSADSAGWAVAQRAGDYYHSFSPTSWLEIRKATRGNRADSYRSLLSFIEMQTYLDSSLLIRGKNEILLERELF